VTLLLAETADRLVALVLGHGESIESARRTMAAGSDGHPPVTVSRNAADRVIRDAREALQSSADVPAVAARILRLLSLELAALEREPGPKDLDRLHRVAQTLGTIERLRPKDAGRAEETGLLSLRQEGT
jgi:hypothetical protein